MDTGSSVYTKVSILAVGDIFHCIVPSFLVLNAMLRGVKLQWMDEYGVLHVFDGFAHHCNLLHHSLPIVCSAMTMLF